jgi:ADP-ribose pyrophosphatase YjhB (NUDIX family)
VAPTSDLARYPRPNVAIDLALLTVMPSMHAVLPGTLGVLIQRRTEVPHGWALPGRFLRKRQTVRDGVADVLRVELGLPPFDVAPQLVRVFDDPDRDERAWTLSLAHAVTRRYEDVAEARGDIVAVDLRGNVAGGQPLLFDHDMIVRKATAALRQRYELHPDPDGLLGQDFTLGELRSVHEAVLGERLRRDTFNRRMVDQLGRTARARSAGGRPAIVYERSADADPAHAVRRLQLPRQT